MSSGSQSDVAERAKQQVLECEREMGQIKAKLRALVAATGEGAESGADMTGSKNALTITWIKTEGLPEAAQPHLKLQLSSPVEEAELTRLYDPLLEQGDDAAQAESTVVFREVETAQAMLTISAWDVDIPLGTSVAYDVATLFTEHNQQSIGSKEPVVTELSVPILPQSSAPSPPETTSAETAPAAEKEKEVTPAESEKEDTAEVKEEEKEAAAGEEAVAGSEANEAAPEPSPAPEFATTTETTTPPTTNDVSEAVCTVTLRISYQPSVQDQRDALYEQLNVVSQKKAAAVEELRQVALTASRQQLTTSSSSGNEPPTKKPAIQAGFLNRSSSNKADKAAPEADTMWTRLQAWYERTLGPESLARRIVPVAKNYVIFFGVVTFFHFQGQQLALPPPV